MPDLNDYEALFTEFTEDEAKRMLLYGDKNGWPPLPCDHPTRPWPVKVYPPVLREINIALAESLQVSPAMVGCSILGVLSIACLGASVRVILDYIERLLLFIMLKALPSERKSAVFSFLIRPLIELARIINGFKLAERVENEMKIKMLENRMAKAIKTNDEDTARSLQAEIDAVPAVRLFDTSFTDVTPEALARSMSNNGGSGSIASAEGCIFNILSGTYSPDPNIDIFLQAYTGERVRIERVNREPITMDQTALAILVAVQPQVMERFLDNEVLLERGLCARFLYCAPESMLGRRNARTARPVSADAANRYSRLIQTLAQQSYDSTSRELHMDAMAMELFYRWSEEVEANIGPGGPWSGIANGWEGKLVGNTVRIAGLLKMADSPDYSLPITIGHFQNAIEIARYFVDQALAITGKAAGLTPTSREVLDEIKKQGESPFSPYDLRQRLRFRKNFKEGAKVDEALSSLAASGYIRLTLPPEWQGVGRKPEAMYELHPDLLTRKN